MRVVIGLGCIHSGIKEKPDDVRLFINKFLDEYEKVQGDLDNFLMYLVEDYGENTYYDKEPCESCGDYYNEYTLEVDDAN